jgi:hypothetical protein
MNAPKPCHVMAPQWCDRVFSDGSHCRWPRGHVAFCFAGLDQPTPRIDGWVEIRSDDPGVTR